MLNKTLLPAALVTSLFTAAIAAPAIAAPDISANVALTSDYRFRGISQSNEDIAIQGGFDIAWDNGIYLGTWGSSVDFDFDSADGYNGSLELDYYGGWAGQITDNVGVDVGYMYYDYPGDSSVGKGDYQEVYGKLNLWNGTIGVNYSDDYYAETGKFYYVFGDYSFGLGENVSLDLHLGYNDVEELDILRGKGGFLSSDKSDFIDYSVALTTTWLSVDWSLAYVGTDLKSKDVFGTDWADDTAVVTISKSL